MALRHKALDSKNHFLRRCVVLTCKAKPEERRFAFSEGQCIYNALFDILDTVFVIKAAVTEISYVQVVNCVTDNKDHIRLAADYCTGIDDYLIEMQILFSDMRW